MPQPRNKVYCPLCKRSVPLDSLGRDTNGRPVMQWHLANTEQEETVQCKGSLVCLAEAEKLVADAR
jgi:hypothetical protein